MRKAVEPVKGKVCRHQRNDPRPRIVPRQLVDGETIVNPRVRRELDVSEEQSVNNVCTNQHVMDVKLTSW